MHYYFIQECKINASLFILQYIQNLISRDGNSPLCIAGLVTSIALGLNLMKKIQNFPRIPAQFLDLNNGRAGQLVKNRDEGGYILMLQNKEVPSIFLPNRACTYPRNMDNWLYDLNAPALGVNVQGGVGNATVDEMENELEQEEPQLENNQANIQIPPIAQAIPSNARVRRGKPISMALDYMYDEIVRHNTDMIQQMQQLRRDPHDYANWSNNGVRDLIDQMQAPTMRMDGLYAHFNVGPPPDQGDH